MIDTYARRRLILEELGKWILQCENEGWTSYLLTFMFNHLRGKRASIIRQMSKELERFYSTLITRTVRNPRSPRVQEFLPKLIAYPDLPVYKHKKDGLDAVTINDGLHFHAIVLIPPVCQFNRLREPLDEHVRLNSDLYLGRLRKTIQVGNDEYQTKLTSERLQRIHVQPTTFSTAGHATYGLKGIKGKEIPYDELLILPRTLNELSPKESR